MGKIAWHLPVAKLKLQIVYDMLKKIKLLTERLQIMVNLQKCQIDPKKCLKLQRQNRSSKSEGKDYVPQFHYLRDIFYKWSSVPNTKAKSQRKKFYQRSSGWKRIDWLTPLPKKKINDTEKRQLWPHPPIDAEVKIGKKTKHNEKLIKFLEKKISNLWRRDKKGLTWSELQPLIPNQQLILSRFSKFGWTQKLQLRTESYFMERERGKRCHALL